MTVSNEERDLDAIIDAMLARECAVVDFAKANALRTFTAECSKLSGFTHVIVSPLIGSPGGWRLTRFGGDEALGHTEFACYLDAVHAAATDYRVDLGSVEFA